MLKNLDFVKEKLNWMKEEKIWPNGLRYLWTDAFGVVLLVSLYKETNEIPYLEEAEWVIKEVYRVLGREKGIRIGEEGDRYGQYFHYLAMWIYALAVLGKVKPEYKDKALSLTKEIHPHFLVPGAGIHWKMREDLSGPEPGYGLGAIDHFHGYVVYSFLDKDALSDEIHQLKEIIDKSYSSLRIDQDLGLGIMLWLTHFKPEETWARVQRRSSMAQLEKLWIDPPGYFCRGSGAKNIRFAFTNYGVSLGLQAIDQYPERVQKVNTYFQKNGYREEYARNSITHIMECVSHFPGEFIRKGAPGK